MFHFWVNQTINHVKKQTYREAIQKLQREADVIYDKCGALRDAATEEEKEHWNRLRGLLGEVNQTFFRLDNGMTHARAQAKLNGTY